MDIAAFQEAKRTFPIERILRERAGVYALRDAFVRDYAPGRIGCLTLDEYAMGDGSRHNFCFRLERELYAIGSISGPPCNKFGVWWSRRHKRYDFDMKFGSNVDEAFAKIKALIVQLLEDGKKEDLQSIARNPLHSLVKGKILSVYFPDKYLNVFSNNHLNCYLDFYELNTKQVRKQDVVYKRKILVDFKNRDKEMKNWTIDMFAVFLFDYFPTDSAGRRQSLINQGKLPQ